ncbi:MAG TPA: DUF4123 domain-containing protein [Flavisolibacter sp.]|nr:DUF4123 domain-containing protein [Flavisolibacter sp.]
MDATKLDISFFSTEEFNQKYESLYKGGLEEDLVDVAPYLCTLQSTTEFKNLYKLNGWGNAWWVLLKTELSFDKIYKHFRKFLLVKTEDGQELYFRFYDPRVLRIFLPTCDSNQLKEFFGPIEYFICEDEDPTYGLIFSLANNQLKTERKTKEEIFGLPAQESTERKFFG